MSTAQSNDDSVILVAEKWPRITGEIRPLVKAASVRVLFQLSIHPDVRNLTS